MPEIDKTLAALAAKLGVSAEKLWPILVQKEIVDWWAQTGLGLFLLLMAVVLGSIARRQYKARERACTGSMRATCPKCGATDLECQNCKWNRWNSMDWDQLGFFTQAFTVVACTAMVLFMAFVIVQTTNLHQLICPEASALRHLLGR